MRFLAMRKVLIIGGLLLALATLLYSPSPFSVRLRRKLSRAVAASQLALYRWRGGEPRLISIKGEVGLAGAQVQALDSESGWASLCDLGGRFTLPDILWYPGAEYELVVSIDDRHSYINFPIEAECAAHSAGA